MLTAVFLVLSVSVPARSGGHQLEVIPMPSMDYYLAIKDEVVRIHEEALTTIVKSKTKSQGVGDKVASYKMVNEEVYYGRKVKYSECKEVNYE